MIPNGVTPDFSNEQVAKLVEEGRVLVGSSPSPFVKACPQCSDLIDLNDLKAATDHILKKHPQRAAEIQQRQMLSDLCDTGILRRV